MVESKGFAYYPEHAVIRVDPAAKRLYIATGVEASFDLLAYVPPHRVPAGARESGLCADSGWVPVDRGTLETQFPRVYAIGDDTGIPLAAGKPLPKAGVFAHTQAEVVAHNIAHAVTGKGEPKRFQGYGACFLETGDGRAGTRFKATRSARVARVSSRESVGLLLSPCPRPSTATDRAAAGRDHSSPHTSFANNVVPDWMNAVLRRGLRAQWHLIRS